MARLRYLSRDDVERIAHHLAERLFTGYDSPLPDFQLMGDEGLAALESSLGLARQPYYRTVYDKAGVLLRSLIKNHPLVDGNKRVGMTAAFVFLLINEKLMIASNEELVEYALRIAKGNPDLSWREISRWLRERTVSTLPADRKAVLAAIPGDRQRRDAVLRRIAAYNDAMKALLGEARPH